MCSSDLSKGNKPDFHQAMVILHSLSCMHDDLHFIKASGASKEMYAAFLDKLRQSYMADRIQGAVESDIS